MSDTNKPERLHALGWVSCNEGMYTAKVSPPPKPEEDPEDPSLVRTAKDVSLAVAVKKAKAEYLRAYADVMDFSADRSPDELAFWIVPHMWREVRIEEALRMLGRTPQQKGDASDP